MSAASGNARDTTSPVAARGPRRASYRTRAEIPGVLARAGVGAWAAWVKCWLRDLSTTGALIEGTLGIERGDAVRLRFGKPFELMTLHATVMRADQKARLFGLKFDPVGEAQADHLYGFVMELAQEYVKYRARHLAWEPPSDAIPPPPR